ncbi:MAG: ABC transporter permease [Christensenellales bacterium]|jgi:ABC-2 type transport system permease protein
MYAVWKREMLAYFLSPIAYVIIGVFMAVAGLFFTTTNLLSQSAEFNATLSNITFIFILIVPVITMRLLSEERKNKTDQLLLTAPVSLTRIIMGKYLAALTVFAITLVFSFVYPLCLAIKGSPAFGEIFAGYVGFFLLGAALISLGLFMSSITENQVTAAIASFGTILLLWLINSITNSLDSQWLVTVLNWLSVYDRYTEFTAGLIGLAPIIYYISFSGVFIFLTIRAVEKRRWSEA